MDNPDQRQIFTKKTIILIPAYNPGSTLSELLQELGNRYPSIPIFVIDDGSEPQISISGPGVMLFRHSRNKGKGEAIKTGLREIQRRIDPAPDAVLFMDADGQHRPSSVADFLSAFERGEGEIIIGMRSLTIRHMPLMRVLSNRITSRLLSWKTGVRLNDCQCGFRLLAWPLILKALPLRTSRYELESELLIKILRYSANVHHIPIETVYADEVSHIKGVRDILAFIKVFFSIK